MFEMLRVGGKVEIMPRLKNEDNMEAAPVYTSQIMDMDDESILCTMPMSEGKLIVLDVGSVAEIYFYSGASIYRANCKISERGKERNIYTVRFEPTEDLKRFQRREFFRLECTLEVAIQVLNETDREYFEKKEQLPDNIVGVEDRAIIVDISGGGLRIFARRKYERNSILCVRFQIMNGDKPRVLRLAGLVVRSMESPNSSDIFDNRIQFKCAKRDETEDIVKFIFEQQRLMRKKERG